MAHKQPKGAVPYVFSAGSCKKHMEYIKDYFQGEITFLIPDQKDSEKVMHAAMTVHNGPLFFSDRLNAYGAPPEDHPASLGTHLYLGFDTFEEGKAAWELAVVKGEATVQMEFAKQEWGSYYGVCQDPFGSVWAICCPDPEAPPRAESKDESSSSKKTKRAEDDTREDDTPKKAKKTPDEVH